MTALEKCPGCGERRLLFPEGRCLDCRGRGGVQLALIVEATDNPTVGEREAIEAAVVQQERDRALAASWSRPCTCRSPWAPDGECVFCGHEPVAVAA